MVFFIKIIGNYLLKIAIFSLIKLELEWAITNNGNYNEQGLQLNLDKPNFEYQKIEDYHENGISIGKVEGGVNSGSGTINNTHLNVKG
jgi:hypothetical protein